MNEDLTQQVQGTLSAKINQMYASIAYLAYIH